MQYTCTIHTDYVDASRKEEVLRKVTKIVTEALLTEEKEERHGKENAHR